jgi:hypothetical protein
MATKQKVAKPSLEEAIASLPTIGSGRNDVGEAQRKALRLGRTLPELDAIATAIDNEAGGRWLLHRLAEEDHAAAKAARQSGSPIPAMPFLEELKRRNEEMTSTKATRSAGGGGGSSRTPKASGIRFTHDGKPVAPSQNKLSSVAWFYTKNLGKGGGRMKVTEFKALLAKLGVADPMAPGWAVKLPNGITVGTVKEGQKPAPVEKAEKPTTKGRPSVTPRKTTKKSTAKKAPAKKAAPKAKATAKPTKLAPDNRPRKAAKKVAAA